MKEKSSGRSKRGRKTVILQEETSHDDDVLRLNTVPLEQTGTIIHEEAAIPSVSENLTDTLTSDFERRQNNRPRPVLKPAENPLEAPVNRIKRKKSLHRVMSSMLGLEETEEGNTTHQHRKSDTEGESRPRSGSLSDGASDGSICTNSIALSDAHLSREPESSLQRLEAVTAAAILPPSQPIDERMVARLSRRQRLKSSYYKSSHHSRSRPFADWTREQLIHHIIYDMGIVLRAEALHSQSSLREFLVAIYESVPPENFPDPPILPERTMKMQLLRHGAARIIQYWWFDIRNQMNDSCASQATSDREEEEEELGSAHQEQEIYELLSREDVENSAMQEENDDREGRIDVGGEVVEDVEAQVGTEMDATPQSIRIRPPVESATQRQTEKKLEKLLHTVWSPPNRTHARNHVAQFHPRHRDGTKYDAYDTTTGRYCCLAGCGEQWDIFDEGKISEFGKYGPVITNYFKFLKWCFWVFFVLCVVTLPVFVVNLQGANDTNSNGLKRISQTMLGNLLLDTNATSDSFTSNQEIDKWVENFYVSMPGCLDGGIFNVPCYLDGYNLSMLYMIVELAVIICISIGFFWLIIFQEKESQVLSFTSFQISPYSLWIKHIPNNIEDSELEEHFAQIVRDNVDSAKNLPTSDIIVSVSIAYDNNEEIDLCTQRGSLIHEKAVLVQRYRFRRTRILEFMEAGAKRKEESQQELLQLRKEFDTSVIDIHSRLESIKKQLAMKQKDPVRAVCAFITFDHTHFRDAVYHAYDSLSFFDFSKKRKLRFIDQSGNPSMPTVKAAPEPSTVQWENLAITKSIRGWRILGTTMFTVLLIAAALFLILVSRYVEVFSSNSASSTGESCHPDFKSWSQDVQREYVDEHPKQLYCYCNQYDTIEQGNDSYCRAYLENNINSQTVQYASSFLILVVNYLIEHAMRSAAEYERHETTDNYLFSVAVRMLLLKYINSALIFSINHNRDVLRAVFNYPAWNLDPSWISDMPEEFSAEWFNTVGVTMVLVQIGNVLSGHVYSFYQYMNHQRRIRAYENNLSLALTRQELERVYTGPPFDLSFHYTQVLSTLLACFSFSSGIPILYWIAVVNFAVFYAVDKYLFVSFYSLASNFNNKIGRFISHCVPIAVLVHLLFAIWMISNQRLFTDTDTSQMDWVAQQFDQAAVVDSNPEWVNRLLQRIMLDSTFPLFVVFCVILFGFLLYEFGLLSSHIVRRIFIRIFGSICDLSEIEIVNKNEIDTTDIDEEIGCCGDPEPKNVFNTNSGSFRMSIRRGRFKGITSYNILANPIYQHKFGIPEKFANTHKYVRGIESLTDADVKPSTAKSVKPSVTPTTVLKTLPSKKSASNRSFYASLYCNPEGNVVEQPQRRSIRLVSSDVVTTEPTSTI